MNLLSALILLRNATAVVGAIGNVIEDLRGFEAGNLTVNQEQELNIKLQELKRKQVELESTWAGLTPPEFISPV